MIRLTEYDLDFIKKYEKFVDHWYDDGYGFITGGYGHRKLSEDESVTYITLELAINWLMKDIEIVENAVSKLVNIATTHNQYLALCSLVFNCGVERFKKSDTRRVVNTGIITNIVERWRTAFITAGGKPSNGLIKRRAEEAQLWLL